MDWHTKYLRFDQLTLRLCSKQVYQDGLITSISLKNLSEQKSAMELNIPKLIFDLKSFFLSFVFSYCQQITFYANS